MKKLLLIFLLLSFTCIVDVYAQPALLQMDRWMDQVSQASDVETISNVQEGSLLVVMVGLSDYDGDVTVSSPTLNFGEDIEDLQNDVRIEMWSAPNASAGSHDITVTVVGQAPAEPTLFIRWGVAEFSGIATSNHVVDTAIGDADWYTTTPDTETVGVTETDTLLVAALRTDGAEGSHGDIFAGTNFTWIWAYAEVEPEQKLVAEYRIVSAGTYSGGFTMDSADTTVLGLVAFKPLSGSVGLTPKNPTNIGGN